MVQHPDLTSVVELRAGARLGLLSGRGAVFLIAAAWVVGQALVVVLFGRAGFVQLGGDSGTFLAAAERFPTDQGTLRGYSGYVAMLALGDFLGSASWVSLAIQNVVLLAACWCMIDLGQRLGLRSGGTFGALALLLNPLFAQWFRYVLTETLFVSGAIILVWTLHRAAIETGRWRWTAVATSILVGSVRPNGALLIASTLSFIAWCIWRDRRAAIYRSAMALPWVIVGLAGLTLSSAQEIHGSENSFATKTVAGEVFWNEPDTALAMPEPARPVLANRDIVRYALDHPAAVGRLYGARLAYELFQIRPRYSGQLNLFALVTTTVVWLAAVLGGWLARKSPYVRALLLVTIPQAVLICVTWATPEGRFGWWLLGPSMVLAGYGLEHVLARARNSSSPAPATG